MENTMAKAPNTIQTAARSTKVNGRMVNTMAKAPNTMKTAASGTKASGRKAKWLSDDSVYETKQSLR